MSFFSGQLILSNNASRSGWSGRQCQTSTEPALSLQFPFVRDTVSRLNSSRGNSRTLIHQIELKISRRTSFVREFIQLSISFGRLSEVYITT